VIPRKRGWSGAVGRSVLVLAARPTRRSLLIKFRKAALALERSAMLFPDFIT
jgi:hypothetical protein